MSVRWVPDILGPGFTQATLPLGQDAEGEVVATLVRALPRLKPRVTGAFRDVDVLYVHGWSDYFFQRRLARTITDRGGRFFALDLRKYGRSLRPGQTPGYITALTSYDEDIHAALAAMDWNQDAPRRDRRLVLLGHSTGGLVLSLWADRHPGVAEALVLNSPWLEFQLSKITRQALSPLVGVGARLVPFGSVPQLDLGFYARAQREVADPDDPVEVRVAWRPERAMPASTGWLAAILTGHAKVSAGLSIDAPVCVLLSARSATPTRWSVELTRSDSVLAVDEVARAAVKLRPSVTVERIDGALHDVFLSAPQPRADAYRPLDRWLRATLAVRGR